MDTRTANFGEGGLAEELRRVMRRWPTVVAVVTAAFEGQAHEMTVNSFTSVSLEPAVVGMTLANETRTLRLLLKSGFFGVTILSENQAEISERFAGKMKDERGRFEGLETFSLEDSPPLITGGCAFLKCGVMFTHALPRSTLILGEVHAARGGLADPPLLYLNRGYHQIKQEKTQGLSG